VAANDLDLYFSSDVILAKIQITLP